MSGGGPSDGRQTTPQNWDSDGCQDSGEDQDDDDDGFHDDVDDCNFLPGTSTQDRRGASTAMGTAGATPTRAGAGSMGRDNYTLDPSQWADIDGDGYGDNPNGTEPDSCPEEYGTSTLDRLGCIDEDGDGLSNEFDDFPSDAMRNFDNDSDGYDDDPDDFCPGLTGFSSQDRMGCPDGDVRTASPTQTLDGQPPMVQMPSWAMRPSGRTSTVTGTVIT